MHARSAGAPPTCRRKRGWGTKCVPVLRTCLHPTNVTHTPRPLFPSHTGAAPKAGKDEQHPPVPGSKAQAGRVHLPAGTGCGRQPPGQRWQGWCPAPGWSAPGSWAQSAQRAQQAQQARRVCDAGSCATPVGAARATRTTALGVYKITGALQAIGITRNTECEVGGQRTSLILAW